MMPAHVRGFSSSEAVVAGQLLVWALDWSDPRRRSNSLHPGKNGGRSKIDLKFTKSECPDI